MDSMRVAVNLLGNCVATFVVSKWEGQFDRDAMLAAFNGGAGVTEWPHGYPAGAELEEPETEKAVIPAAP
jgi:aerobic C4-dicarboxylate transport protein